MIELIIGLLIITYSSKILFYDVTDLENPRLIGINEDSDPQQNVVSDDLVTSVSGILNKPNMLLTTELMIDGYWSSFSAGDCRLFEQHLQVPKRIHNHGDKKFQNSRNIKQMENIENVSIWDDFFMSGANNSKIMKDDNFIQYLSLPIRAC